MICSYEVTRRGLCESADELKIPKEMLKCSNARKKQNTSGGHSEVNLERDGEVTDDPLAAMDPRLRGKQIYSVSRINPLFNESLECTLKKPDKNKKKTDCRVSPQSSTKSAEKSSSSGYGGSNGGSSNEPLYCEQLKEHEDSVTILNQSPISSKSSKNDKSTSLTDSYSSSSTGSLSTIHEDILNFTIPRPIWPRRDSSFENNRNKHVDSLINDTFLLYKNINYYPHDKNIIDVSIKEVLTDLLGHIHDTIDGRNGVSSEEMLEHVKERITLSLKILKESTEEEMRQLCVNLSKSREINSVVRAFSSSSYRKLVSDRWNQEKNSSNEDIYPMSSSSGASMSDSNSNDRKRCASINELPVFVHDGLSSVPNGLRNAMIYGTLCRVNFKTECERCSDKERLCEESPKKSLLKAVNDGKPSVWEQYYGVRMVPKEKVKLSAKPTDVPLFPGGRPEADFTLDMPRSELLSKKMKADKKWRCRCRLLTTFLGLVFFLLSVMAVSLMLTRGKRMFGSMV